MLVKQLHSGDALSQQAGTVPGVLNQVGPIIVGPMMIG